MKINELHKLKPFFRKMLLADDIYSRIEYSVYDFIYTTKYKIPNIVNIYNLTHTYIDMELLNTKYNLKQKHIHQLVKTKQQLQHLGICYIDWSLRNTGVDENDNIKIFDFDASGIYDKKTLKWIVNPPKLNNYNNAINNNYIDPISIDNYLFHEEIYSKIKIDNNTAN